MHDVNVADLYVLLVAMSQTPPNHSGGIPAARQAPIVTLSSTSAHDPALSRSGSHVMSTMHTGLHTTSSASTAHTQSSGATGVQHSSSTGHAMPSIGSEATSIGPHPTPFTGPQTTSTGTASVFTTAIGANSGGARPKTTSNPGVCNPQPATCTSATISSNTSGIRHNITMTNQALCDKINREHVVPANTLPFPEYCFSMETDFVAKKANKDKSRADLYQIQISMIGIMLSGYMNTCGGILALLDQFGVNIKLIDDWRNNLNKQMKHLPTWIYKACISIPIIQRNRNGVDRNDIVMFVKKSPRTITYNTHMFIRSPHGDSKLADSDSLISVLHIVVPTKYTPHHETNLFTKSQRFQYGYVLPPESMHIEYKHWQVNSVTDAIDKIKTIRNTKGLLSLANNVSGGCYVIGVEDVSCQVKGLILSQADQTEFRARLTSWMTADDAGTPRIWGSECHVPHEGADKDWEVTFIPVHNCPGRHDRRLIVIHMHHCHGGMFESIPECYQVNDEGNVTALPFEQWKQRIIREPDQNSANAFSTQSTVVRPLSPPVCQPSTAIMGLPAVCTQSAITRSMSTMTHSSPTVTLQSPSVTQSSRVVTLQSPFVTLTSSAVTLPSPAVTIPSPAVTLPSPSVTLPSPVVTLPSSTVTLPSPAVTLPLPAVTLQAHTLSQGSATVLAEAYQHYHSASWTKCSNWTAFLTKAVTDEHIIQGSQMSEFQLLSPLNLVPSEEQMMSSYPSDQVKAIVDALNIQYPDIPGVALTFSCWAEIFDLDQNIIPPIDHVLDTIILLEDLSLEVWSSFSNALSHSNRVQRKAYGFEICRIIKRYILKTSKHSTRHTAINLSIKSYIFPMSTKTLHSFRTAGDSLYEHYESCLGRTEGILLEMVLTRVVNCTVSKIVWLKNRTDNDITYHLTQQQCDAFLQFCNDRILMIEAAPGCGKSVMAAYICQRFGGPNKPGNVFYISPRKGFAAIVKHQGNAETYVAYDTITLKQAILVIKQANYKVIVVDDIQATSSSQCIWSRLLDTVHGQKARLLLLMDSEYQDFHNSGSCEALRFSMDKFCRKKHIPRKSSITLTRNLRNSQKVFSFLVAQIESHEDASSLGEFTCGHDIEGDDVHIRVIDEPWKDSDDNGLIQLVTKLITQQSEHRYEVKHIVLLIDDTDPQTATKLRDIFSTHSAISTCQASDIPHQGLVVDLVDEFIGMEASVCLVIFPPTNRSHNMKYRVFTASRGIMRTELVFMDDISADFVKTMALTNLAEAETRTPVQ